MVQFSSQISDEGQNRQGVPSCSQVAAMKEALFQILGDGDLIPDAVRLGKGLYK